MKDQLGAFISPSWPMREWVKGCQVLAPHGSPKGGERKGATRIPMGIRFTLRGGLFLNRFTVNFQIYSRLQLYIVFRETYILHTKFILQSYLIV